jgi:hypothetical protein
MWWIAAGVVAVALGGLVVAVLALLGHLAPLNRAVRRLDLRVEQAERMQGRIDGLQQTLVGMQERLEQTTVLVERARPPR